MIWHHTTDSNNVEWIYLAKTKPSIRSIAKTISQISPVMRATVRTLRESAAIEEIIQAAYEATIAARDTSIELHNVAKDLRGNQNLRKNQ